jgi:hypothetical protein
MQRSHAALTGPQHHRRMHPSPVTILLLAIALGVMGAATVVIFASVISDAVGGAVGLAALAVVIRSTIQLAGDAPGDDAASQHP